MGELVDDMICGFSCSWCGIYFEEEHGYPVICITCYEENNDAASDLQVATIPELGEPNDGKDTK